MIMICLVRIRTIFWLPWRPSICRSWFLLSRLESCWPGNHSVGWWLVVRVLHQWSVVVILWEVLDLWWHESLVLRCALHLLYVWRRWLHLVLIKFYHVGVLHCCRRVPLAWYLLYLYLLAGRLGRGFTWINMKLWFDWAILDRLVVA